MATGGSGDVLTGVIAALIGQKLPAFEAAQLGVFVHGLAGDIARDHHGEIGMIAGDIVDAAARRVCPPHARSGDDPLNVERAAPGQPGTVRLASGEIRVVRVRSD